MAVFPGVEITSAGGERNIHIVALIDVTKEEKHITALLTALGLDVDGIGEKNALVKKNAIEIIDINHERGGIAVIAHANSTSGVLEKDS